MRIGPPRDVAGGVHTGGAGLEIGVHLDAAVDRETGARRQREQGPHANADDDQVCRERRPVIQGDARAIDATDRPAQVEYDALRLVELTDEAANLRSHDAFERNAFGSDDMNVEASRAERRGDLEADETR